MILQKKYYRNDQHRLDPASLSNRNQLKKHISNLQKNNYDTSHVGTFVPTVQGTLQIIF